MAPRRTDSLKPANVASHLGVMVAVAAVMGVLVAGLAIPFAGVAGLGAKQVAHGMNKLPAKLIAKPLAQRTRLLASNGQTLATLYDQNRVNVNSLSQVAPIMRKAIISIEDYRYYQHGALDLRGTLRAFVTNQTSGGTVQGGSSITQQMVKMTLLNQAKTKAQRIAATADTYQRKINELRYAIAFEQNYSKDWIFKRYLNIAYFGDGAYGIQAAAHHYFSVPASKLNLDQAAMLAGLVKNPSGYDPTSFPGPAKDRRDTVIDRMAQLNVISKSEADKAKSQGLGLHVTPARNGCVSSSAPFFCDYAVQYMMADPALGKTVDDRKRLLYSGGLTVHTTIDPRMQRASDASMRKHVYPTNQAIGGMAFVVPGTGEVRALSQSRPMGANRRTGQTYLNYVVPPKYGDSNGFQAGSTFKAFVLSAAIKQGIPLSTQINAPQSISLPVDNFRRCSGYIRSADTWHVENSTGAGTFNLYTGTQQSVNTFFAQLEQRVGLCQPVKLARAMGVNVPESQVFPPFTLGITDTNPLTMASAYATFAARGVHCDARPVTSVVGSGGKEIESYPKRCKQVLPSDVADAVNDILRGVQEPGGFGYDNNLELNQQSAGKTGTTDSNRAVWFIGYTPNLAGATMLAGANSLGHWMTLNGQTVGGVYIEGAHGSTNAGPIWGDAMHVIERYLPNAKFHAPNPNTIKGQTATVPTVYGYSLQHAMQVLRQAGFQPVIGPKVNSSNQAGSVAYLSPGSGSQVPTGTSITIYVSDGTPYVPPPPPKPSTGGGGGGGGGGGTPGGGNNGNGHGHGGGGHGRHQ